MVDTQSSKPFHRQKEDLQTHKQLCLDQNTQERYRLMLQFKEACKVYSFLLQNLKTL